ncbi:protein tyrosine phosphatase [Solirubrobacter sp. CPCC 204708]|uniref:protein-tyrosine-phosphatase n=1 Tax=Solirubrobacter deserti TaxID=2282478 RepID=A0ABT4RDV4_9ACTN|nr:CpsB/CapC family capsule biosynthesis tyrosine phosphatase [Solirubrobacter deserti]MBE2314505.1 protein tyrosine phosphatase [Solirubrobacter deserti]MDA0136510.1 hypothetical protein [Solirubrobacter deserti]
MLDLHSHVLPGLDDGAASAEEAVAIARAACADGVRVLAATPHVRSDYPTTASQLDAGLRALPPLPIDVVRGGEVSLEVAAALPPDDLAPFAIAGSRYLLVEPPYTGLPLNAGTTLFLLRLAGFVPIIAHPERNPDVQADPSRLRELVEAGALAQLTAGSLTGRRGATAQRTARVLLQEGLAHLVAGDAHRPLDRSATMSRGLAAVGDEALAEWLGRSVPAAILADEDIPPRPATGRTRRRRRVLAWRTPA